MKNNNNRTLWKHIRCMVLGILFFGAFVSCDDFVDIEPSKTEILNEAVFSDLSSVKSALSGIYSNMLTGNGFASGAFNSYHLFGSLSADELINYQDTNFDISTNSLTPLSASIDGPLWRTAYRFIFASNAILEGLPNLSGVSQVELDQIEGEAKFIRAFCYFYLTNLYGDIPLHLTIDFLVTSTASRTPQAQVYDQIVSDLLDAQDLMTNDAERVRPNKIAATALLARTYLYMANWTNAEAEATSVIGNAGYNLQSDLNLVFLASSTEAIWQLEPIEDGFNTNEGRFFILFRDPTSTDGVELSTELLGAFETGDNRRVDWVTSFIVDTNEFFYSNKYKVQSGNIGGPDSEYSMVLRLAEQYLIRAEARAQQNNISGAQDDLNAIRNRAGLTDTTANTQAALLLAIEQERRIEFFFEWGHRWLDLKRTNRADAVLGPLKAPNWQSTDVLYPIPQEERLANPNITQNEGYDN